MSNTYVVEPEGKFPTVSAAVKAADSGDCILVRPGRYEDSIVVDKPVEIIGDGPRQGIEIWGSDGNVLYFTAVHGRVAGLTLRQPDNGKRWGVFIKHGRLELADCDISSDAGDAVAICHGADPLLRRNVISNAKESGVEVYDGGRGTIEDNEIFGCNQANVWVSKGSIPVFRRNVIRGGADVGVGFANTGLGLFEENVISGNAGSGVAIKAFGNPTLRGNRITLNGWYGVHVWEDGAGVVEDNDLTGNRRGAWDINHHAKHSVTRARNRE